MKENTVYDRIMLADECIAIRHRNEQSIVVENVTFNRKTEHNFIASQYSSTYQDRRGFYRRYLNG